jgi:hypothetical protein
MRKVLFPVVIVTFFASFAFGFIGAAVADEYLELAATLMQNDLVIVDTAIISQIEKDNSISYWDSYEFFDECNYFCTSIFIVNRNQSNLADCLSNCNDYGRGLRLNQEERQDQKYEM